MCVHACMFAHVEECIWRPKVDVGYFIHSPPGLLRQGLSHRPGAHWLSCMPGQPVPGIFLSPVPQPLWSQTHAPIWIFIWVPGIPTQVLMLTWQTLYQLSHLPSPFVSFYMWETHQDWCRQRREWHGKEHISHWFLMTELGGTCIWIRHPHASKACGWIEKPPYKKESGLVSRRHVLCLPSHLCQRCSILPVALYWFWDRISRNPGWPQTYCVTKDTCYSWSSFLHFPSAEIAGMYRPGQVNLTFLIPSWPPFPQVGIKTSFILYLLACTRRWCLQVCGEYDPQGHREISK